MTEKRVASAFRTASAIALAAFLASCAATPRPTPEVALDRPAAAGLERETAPFRAGGSAAIAAQAVLETPRGRVVAGEGTPIVLTPATTWSSAIFQRDVVAGDRMPEQAEGELVWRATTDADGRATFRALAPGDYLIASPIGWRLAGEGTLYRTDVAFARVHVAAGEQVAVTATRTVTETMNEY